MLNISKINWFKVANAHFPWIVIIFLSSTQSALSGELISIKLLTGVDKVIHFMIFGLLGWNMSRGFVLAGQPWLRRNYLWVVPVLGSIYAIVDEYHQSMVPGRSPDLLDWIADVAGIVTFVILFSKLGQRERKPGKS